MSMKKYDPPLWSILYPVLLDKTELIRIYTSCKNQKAACNEIGCSDRTLRKALRYHGIKKPFAIVHKDSEGN